MKLKWILCKACIPYTILHRYGRVEAAYNANCDLEPCVNNVKNCRHYVKDEKRGGRIHIYCNREE